MGLVIGLGGTGCRVVRRVKRALQRHFGGRVPGGIQFLGIDADKIEREGLEAEEFLLLTEGFEHAMTRQELDRIVNEKKDIVEFWPPGFQAPIDVFSKKAGLKENRILGRLVYRYPSPRVLAKLIQKLRNCEYFSRGAGAARGELPVYLVSSTCGGTGSGMIQDAILQLNALAKDPAIGLHLSVRPVLFLPGVYFGRPGVDDTRIAANAYCCLHEFEHLLRSSEPRLHQGFPMRVVFSTDDASRPLRIEKGTPDAFRVHCVSLIDSIDDRGTPTLADPGDLADFAAHCVTRDILLDDVQTSMAVNPGIEGKLEGLFEDRFTKRFSTSGIAALTFPRQEARKLLVCNAVFKILDEIDLASGETVDASRDADYFLTDLAGINRDGLDRVVSYLDAADNAVPLARSALVVVQDEIGRLRDNSDSIEYAEALSDLKDQLLTAFPDKGTAATVGRRFEKKRIQAGESLKKHWGELLSVKGASFAESFLKDLRDELTRQKNVLLKLQGQHEESDKHLAGAAAEEIAEMVAAIEKKTSRLLYRLFRFFLWRPFAAELKRFEDWACRIAEARVRLELLRSAIRLYDALTGDVDALLELHSRWASNKGVLQSELKADIQREAESIGARDFRNGLADVSRFRFKLSVIGADDLPELVSLVDGARSQPLGRAGGLVSAGINLPLLFAGGKDTVAAALKRYVEAIVDRALAPVNLPYYLQRLPERDINALFEKIITELLRYQLRLASDVIARRSDASVAEVISFSAPEPLVERVRHTIRNLKPELKEPCAVRSADQDTLTIHRVAYGLSLAHVIPAGEYLEGFNRLTESIRVEKSPATTYIWPDPMVKHFTDHLGLEGQKEEAYRLFGLGRALNWIEGSKNGGGSKQYLTERGYNFSYSSPDGGEYALGGSHEAAIKFIAMEGEFRQVLREDLERVFQRNEREAVRTDLIGYFRDSLLGEIKGHQNKVREVYVKVAKSMFDYIQATFNMSDEETTRTLGVRKDRLSRL